MTCFSYKNRGVGKNASLCYNTINDTSILQLKNILKLVTVGSDTRAAAARGVTQRLGALGRQQTNEATHMPAATAANRWMVHKGPLCRMDTTLHVLACMLLSLLRHQGVTFNDWLLTLAHARRLA